ncbi:redoxin domain-containing protein [Nocardioides eburneiflavus]|uniref:Redoxin domain-containing protein n=1 Tax=Nocardioides eburneiflavus TaxID=2518372 RepID=A0A4Z1CDP4_9ACTN|nr:redoxin domain-containing protein [Nocardioides eburneiflavus]TGN62577.1 redoxin domain-containing protein [Nocardioides eburneiflavus]
MRRLALAVVAPLALSLAACGGEATTADAPGSTSAPDSPSESPGDTPSDSAATDGAEQPDAAVPALLDFTSTTVAGEDFDGASLAGRPVVLWFWAPWCPTCRGQVPQVEDLAGTYGDEVSVVGIGSLDSAEAIADFARDVEGITHLEDTDGVLWQRFGVTEQSSFVVLGADGEVAFEAGYGGEDDLAAEVEAVLG